MRNIQITRPPETTKNIGTPEPITKSKASRVSEVENFIDNLPSSEKLISEELDIIIQPADFKQYSNPSIIKISPRKKKK